MYKERGGQKSITDADIIFGKEWKDHSIVLPLLPK